MPMAWTPEDASNLGPMLLSWLHCRGPLQILLPPLSGADASRGLDHAIQLPGGVSCIFHSRPASDASLFEKLHF